MILAKAEIYVANPSLNEVQVISDIANSVVANVTGVGGGGKTYYSPKRGLFELNLGGTGVAYDSGKGEIFVTNSDLVYVISDTSNTVVAEIPLGGDPFGIAYDSGKGEIYVANPASNMVSVISAGLGAPASPSPALPEFGIIILILVVLSIVVVSFYAVALAKRKLNRTKTWFRA